MKYVQIVPSLLKGEVDVPPSKSLSHRAIIAAALSDGVSQINPVIFSDDIMATCQGMESLGAKIEKKQNGLVIRGVDRPIIQNDQINCKESGSTLRFLIPIALLTGEKVTFDGRGRLKSRPLTPYYKIFERQNIFFRHQSELPLMVKGKLKPDVFEIEGNISSQLITGLLYALPLLEGDSKIVVTSHLESRGYVDLTIDVLKRFSIRIENDGYQQFFIAGNQKYRPVDFYEIEKDFSQAAFWLAAGLLGGEIHCKNLNIHSLQGDREILSIIERMGGNIRIEPDRVITTTSNTREAVIDVSQCPDLAPILAVLGAVSSGRTQIINASRLRLKESDRLRAISKELTKLGADIVEKGDALIIHGKDTLKGGIVESWNDHRIAMALAIASIKCREPVIIKKSDVIKKSYPDFFKDFLKLGGIVDERDMG